MSALRAAVVHTNRHLHVSLLRKTQNTDKTGHFLETVIYIDQYLHKKEVLDFHNKVTTSETLISDYKVRSQVRNNVKSSLIMVYYLY